MELNEKDEKIIKVLSWVLGGHAIYVIKNNLESIYMLLGSKVDTINLFFLIYILSIILLPISLILFVRKIRIGWFLLCIYLTHYFTSVCYNLIIRFSQKPTGNEIIDNAINYNEAKPIGYILAIIMTLGSIYVICRPSIREAYKIKTKNIIWTTITTATFSILSEYYST